MDSTIDLSIAFRKLHQLQLEDGDLGAQYWLEITRLLQNAAAYRDRALTAEARLQQIIDFVNREQSS